MSGKNKSKQFAVIGFYRKKILFFSLVFLFAYLAINFIKIPRNSADTNKLNLSSNVQELNVNVDIQENGKIKINDQESQNQVDLVNNELRLVVVDNPLRSYDRVAVFLTLPASLKGEVKPEILAVHGVGSATNYIKNSNTIVYEATDVSPQAIITIVAKLPPDSLNLGLAQLLQKQMLMVKSKVWLLMGIILPLITFTLMMIFLSYQYRRQKIDLPEKETSVPPMAIPPAVVGALFNQKVGSRDIAATLIDLAERGDIVILDRERGFAFGKGRFDQRLLGFEKILLSKIFSEHLTSDRKEIERRINDHFYSKKMSMVTAGIYALATRLGYFKVNPQKSLAKYRLLGIFFFLLALGGFVFSIIKFTDPPYVVFFWVGMMASALIISITASRLPIRTIIGQEVLSNWLAFKKFLTNPESFPYSEYNQQIFRKYLPYAIVLNCEAAWAKRFADHNFVMPEWFLTEKTSLGLEDFCLSLFPIVSYVSRSLSASREPGFE